MFARVRALTGSLQARIVAGLAIAGLAGVTLAGLAVAVVPPVGAQAPDFRLQDQNGKWHSLSDYRGKWVVLYFYPKDKTPGCTTQACDFSENVFAFRSANAVILGVSVQDVASHKAFEEWLKKERQEQVGEHGLPFPILADTDKRTAAAYDVLKSIPIVGQLASRQTFIIDPQGRIAKHYPKVTAEGHSQAVLADLKTLAKPKA